MGDFGELLRAEWLRGTEGQAMEAVPERVWWALERHYDLLRRWNERLNLTAIRSAEEAARLHYCECLFFAQILSRAGAGPRILDFGSGAGFPGFVLAAWRPDWELTLLESHQRKAVFLREAGGELGNVRVVADRAERISGHWDWVVSRAVRPAEVVTHIPRLASSIGMLIAESDWGALRAVPSLAWRDPVPLPWGVGRVAVLGSSISSPA